MACIRDLCSTSLGTTARWQLICPAPGLEQAARFKLLSASSGAKIQLGMNPRPIALTVALLALTSTLLAASDKPNTLTAQEQAAGWQLLFDGQSLAGWRPYKPPEGKAGIGAGWKVVDGLLKKLDGVKGGDIITEKKFEDFELTWEWRIEKGANNGVKYFVTEERPGAPGHEYQMLDDEAEAWSKIPAKDKTASFYQVLPPAADKGYKPAGEWNSSRILVKGNHVEHWLNGKKAVEYELGSEAVKAAIANSKFKKYPDFGQKIRGHIMLTDHQSEAWFRNIKLRELVANAGDKIPSSAFGWEAMPNNTGLALMNKAASLPVWRAVCDPAQPKPYIYPLATLDGTELTANAPADHVWHHSLWFAWKYINGINYWEVDPKTGLSAGRTIIKSASFRHSDDLSARVEMAIEYAPPGQPPVLRESRVMEFTAPRANGAYAIDWDSQFTVGETNITLDRTPPKAQSGGYAGLSLRFPKGTKGWNFLTSEGAHSAADGNGKPARWVDFSGPTAKGTLAGITVFDHPANPRHPTAWYLNESHPYFSPALIYQEPMTLKAGAKMRLRYRVLVHEGPADRSALNAEFDDFARRP